LQYFNEKRKKCNYALKYHRNVKLELKYLYIVLLEIFEYNNYLIMQDYYYRIFKIDIIYH